MLCCVVLLSIVGIVLRRKQADDPFPPRARRRVDGSVAADQPIACPIIHHTTAAARATALRWGAFGVVTYVSVVAALLGVGAAESMDGSGLHWFVRDLTFAMLAAVALAVAARGPADCPDGRRLALALIGAGSAWTVLGLIDMHVFMLFEIAGGRMLPDAVFHGIGVWAPAGGVYLLRKPNVGRAAAQAEMAARAETYGGVHGKLTA